MILVALATGAFGQNANPLLDQLVSPVEHLASPSSVTTRPSSSELERPSLFRHLELFLREHSHGLDFTQRNDFDNSYIRCDWHAQLDTIAMTPSQLEDAINTIRTTFADMRKDATESYMYEYHQNGADTISFNVAYSDDDSEIDSHRSGHYVHYWEAQEAFNFRYDGTFGHYNHFREVPRDISEADQKPFDIAAFEAHIQPVLEQLMKLKGAKSYPVYWQHDKEYVDSTGTNGLGLYGGRLPDDPQAGLTTGTHYFIPAQYNAGGIYVLLHSQAYDYVERHPEQPYKITYLPIILRISRDGMVDKGAFHTATGDIVQSDIRQFADLNSTKYNLRCYQDDDGLHILSLTTKGILWIPKYFQKMKRWVNGKATFRKN